LTSLMKQQREVLGHPEQLESLSLEPHQLHVELLPSPKTCSNDNIRLQTSTVYEKFCRPLLTPPDESIVIENTGPPVFTKTTLTA
jgi:hypothetical protein